MECQINLSEDDYVNKYLYMADSKRFDLRLNAWTIIYVVGLMLIVVLCFIYKDALLALIFLALTILVMGFYRPYLKWRYINHYTRYVRKRYGKALAKTITIKVTDDYLVSTDVTEEEKIRLEKVEEITETDRYYFICAQNKQAVIIPKSQLPNDGFINYLKQRANAYNLPVHTNLKWKFR